MSAVFFSQLVVHVFPTFGLFIPLPLYSGLFHFCNFIPAVAFSLTDLTTSLPTRSTYLSSLNLKGTSFLKSFLLLYLKMTSSFPRLLELLIHNPWDLLILFDISYMCTSCIWSKRILKIKASVLYIFMSSPKLVHYKWWDINPDNNVMLCHLSMSQFSFPWNEDANIYISLLGHYEE